MSCSAREGLNPYHTYSKIWMIPVYYLIIFLNYYDRLANSVAPQFDRSLHCLFMLSCPNIYLKYGNTFQWKKNLFCTLKNKTKKNKKTTTEIVCEAFFWQKFDLHLYEYYKQHQNKESVTYYLQNNMIIRYICLCSQCRNPPYRK